MPFHGFVPGYYIIMSVTTTRTLFVILGVGGARNGVAVHYHAINQKVMPNNVLITDLVVQKPSMWHEPNSEFMPH